MPFKYCPPKKLDDLKSETLPDGKRYYTLPDGTRLPSVTTVIGAKKKQSIMEWRKRVGEDAANKISKQATSRGTNLHKICEDYLNNQKSTGIVMPDALEMFKSIRKYLDKIDNIHYQEVALWSKALGLAGRVDLIGEYDGVLSVVDFKTTKRIKKEEDIQDYFAQCTAYSLMYEELIGNPIDQIVVIMAVEDETPLVFVRKTEDYINTLVEYIKFYKNNS